MDFDALFQTQLDELKDEGNYRIFAELERQCGAFPRARATMTAKAPDEVTVWCSNDYLGMGQHPKVMDAMKDAIDACGAGAGGTRNISGTNHASQAAGGELADLHGKEARCSSPRAMCRTGRRCRRWARACPNAVILSDALNHASMIEGIRHSRAQQGDLEAQRPRGSGPQAGRLCPRTRPRSWRSRASIPWTATSARWPRSSRSPKSTAR